MTLNQLVMVLVGVFVAGVLVGVAATSLLTARAAVECTERREASFSQQGPEEALTQTRVETIERECR